MNRWSFFWSVWIVVGAIMEVIALLRIDKNDTLSEQIWDLISIPGYGKFVAWMLSAFMVWAIVHFISRGRFA